MNEITLKLTNRDFVLLTMLTGVSSGGLGEVFGQLYYRIQDSEIGIEKYYKARNMYYESNGIINLKELTEEVFGE